MAQKRRRFNTKPVSVPAQPVQAEPPPVVKPLASKATKTSFRLTGEVVEALAQLAEIRHNGSRTEALFEAVRRYHQAALGQAVGWVAVTLAGQASCSTCGKATGGVGFVQLNLDGRLVGGIRCPGCAGAEV